MKKKNILLVALMVLLTGMVSCKKDHDIPTGKTFNEGSGEGGSTASYTVSVSIDPSNGGKVSGGGKYQEGQTCVVTASANEGYVFNHWTENGNQVSNDVSYSFTVTADRNLVANFAVSSGNFTITAVASPIEGGTVNGGGTYQQGQSCTVTAIANEGYTFTKWTENDAYISPNPSLTFTVSGNRSLKAHFSAESYTITVLANSTEGGVAFGGGNFYFGQRCTVTAQANNDYIFTNWKENGNVVSSDANYTFTVDGNRTLVAYFNYDVSGITGAIHADSPAFVAWATGCTVERGPMRVDKPGNGLASYGVDSDALGIPGGTMDVVSLGDGGTATLTFASPICNEAGPDFAIFENGIEDAQNPTLFYLELGFVEVSSDGVNFFRFPAVTNVQTETQLGSSDFMDPGQIHNFAGKYLAMYGTPFDLDDLDDNVLLDKNNVTHIRIIDVVGSIDPQYATYDSEGHPVNDPWPTAFSSSGFDLDAVGVIHDVAHFRNNRLQ